MHAGSCQGRIRVARHIIFVCVCRTPNTLARCCRGSWRDAASLFLLDCICVFAGCLPVMMRPRLGTRMCVCVSESVPGIFYNSNPVGKCLPHPAFPFLSLRVAALPKPAPTPCAQKICVKLVTQRHASHTNQPLAYVSTVQGQRDDRSNLRPVSRREPKNSRR